MADSHPIRQSVILAAGFGSRLAEGRQGLPKCLVPLAGRTLLEHALEHAATAGVERAVVVVGSQGAAVARYLADKPLPIQVRVVFNPRPAEPNGTSLLAAEDEVDEWFFVQMSDHVFSRPVLQDLAARARPLQRSRLAVDPQPTWCDENDATKVRVESGLPVAIGKELTRWNAVDAGLFLLRRDVFAVLRRLPRGRRSVTEAMRGLIAEQRLEVVALERIVWVDIDTPEDLRVARGIFEPGEEGCAAHQSHGIA